MFLSVSVHLQTNATFIIFGSLSLKRLSDDVGVVLLHLYLCVISHEHQSDTLSKFLQVGLLAVEYQGSLPLMIHIAVKRYNGGTLLVKSLHLSRSPSGVDSSHCCCVTTGVT